MALQVAALSTLLALGAPLLSLAQGSYRLGRANPIHSTSSLLFSPPLLVSDTACCSSLCHSPRMAMLGS